MQIVILNTEYKIMKPHKLLSDSFLPVLLVVIVGAFLFSGMPITKDDLVIPTPTPSPDGGGGGGGGGGKSPAPVSPAPVDWSLSFTLGECKTTSEGIAKTININAGGPANGYISLDIVQGGTTKNIASAAFINPSRIYSALVFPDGKPRKLTLIEGGSSSGEKWSGGTTRKTQDIPAVTCP